MFHTAGYMIEDYASLKVKFSRSTGFAYVELISVIAVISLAAFIFYTATTNREARTEANKSLAVATPAEEDTAASRDKVRQEHAIEFASGLFYVHLIAKQEVGLSQQDFDSFSGPNDQDAALDPLTGKAYVFNEAQNSMKPGEVTYRVNATCDNKISGSDGKGMIIDSPGKSVAIALKLESGAFACQSSL